MESENSRKTPSIQNRCSYCGSDNIARHIRLNQNAEVGRIGLTYQARMVFLGTETLFIDLCDACGTVARIYVDTPGKRWVTK